MPLQAYSDKSNAIKYILLSIDGGGIRGVIPLRILEHICNKIGKSPEEIFHLMAGTSTGGIIVLGLNTPKPESSDQVHSIQDMLDLYPLQKSGHADITLHLAFSDGLLAQSN